MADGQIKIAINVDGKDLTIVNKQLDGMQSSGKKASSGIKDIVTGMGLLKVASSAIGVMKQSLDAAISRFDTMQKYPKVLSALGFSAEDSEQSIKKLSDGIEGLPTKLDEVVSTTQSMTAMTGNLNKSTNATLALNNAFLASGASAEDASRGTTQYLQMLAKGEVDMQSWRSMQESMSVGLQKVAQDMGFTGEAATTDLYGALKGGDVTFNDFQNHLIKLGTGTGELAEMAKLNSEGIATSFSNLRNAVGKGLAKVIEAMDNVSKKVTGKTIAKNIDSAKVVINKAFDAIANSAEKVEPLLIGVGEAFKWTAKNADYLIPILGGVATAYAALKIIKTVSSWSKENADLLLRAVDSGKNLVLVTKAQMAAEVAKMSTQKTSMAVTAANNGLVTASSLLYGVLTGSISLSTAASIAMTAATAALSTALKVLTGPVGWVVAGIGALAAAGTALYRWITKETDASKKLNKEQKNLAETTDTLTEASKNNAANRKDGLKDVDSSREAYKDLADELGKLSEKEKLSGKDKKLMETNVDSLNKSVEGLNITYDKESGMLNMTTEQIKARIDAMSEQDTVNESQQQLTDILKEQHDVESQLKETSQLREEWNQKLADGSVKASEHKKAIEDLDNQEKTLTQTQTALQTEYQNTQAVQGEAAAAVAAAAEESTSQQIIAYELLSDAQKTAVDSMRDTWQSYADDATNMFDVLSDKQTLSVEEMQANLEENQRVVGAWSDNIAALAARGVDEGLLATLRDAGPESAGYVAALVGSSDVELQNLSTTFANGGTVATDAFKEAFGVGNESIPTEVMNMVTSAKDTLTTEIASADFASLGKNVADGTAQGISDGAKAAGNASKDMANLVGQEFSSALEIHSPSKVFQEKGGYLAEGLALGIENGKAKIKTALDSMAKVTSDAGNKIKEQGKKLATEFPNAFSSLQSSMNRVGANAMAGLASGINSNAGSALSAARSVANKVTATIQDALKIHSPSRVMRDEVGKFIPEGIAEGIKGDAKTVYNAMAELKNGLMAPISPELALKTNRMGLSGAVNQITNNNFYNKNDELISAIEKISNRVIVVEQNIDGRAFSKVVATPITQQQMNNQRMLDLVHGRG